MLHQLLALGPMRAQPPIAALLLILWSRDASPAPGARPLPSRHISAGSFDTPLPSRSHLSVSSNSGHIQRRPGGFSGTAQLTLVATAAPGFARLPRAKFPKNRGSLKLVAQDKQGREGLRRLAHAALGD